MDAKEKDKLFLLELYKRNTLIKEQNKKKQVAFQDKLEEKRYHAVVGYYDLLMMRVIDDFRHVFADMSLLPDGDDILSSFRRYSSVLFPIIFPEDATLLQNESDLASTMCCKDKMQSGFYAIASYRLSNSLLRHLGEKETNLDFNSGDRLLYRVKQCLLKRFATQIKSDGLKDIQYQILGNMGSFDITIIIKSDYISEMLNLINNLRQLRYSESDYEKSKKGDRLPLLFSYSSSFISISPCIDAKYLKADDCDVIEAEASVSMYAPLNNEILNKIRGLYADEADGVEILDIKSVLGDYDISVRFKMKKRHLVDMFTGNGENSLFSICNPIYTHKFRSTKTMLGVDIDSSGLIGNAPKNIDDIDHDTRRRIEEVMTKRKDIKELYNKAKPYIPNSISYTVEGSINACLDLMLDDLKSAIGKKTYNMLVKVFEKINDNAEINNRQALDFHVFESIIDCFHDVSMILPSALHMDSYSLDSSEIGYSVNPLTKCFFSYEHMLKQVFDQIDSMVNRNEDKNGNILPFLTVGNYGIFCSKQYFRTASGTDMSERLISFNIPSASSFILYDFVPYILHEIGHYARLNNDRGRRNKCFNELLLLHCTIYTARNYYVYAENKSDTAPALIASDVNKKLSGIISSIVKPGGGGVDPNMNMMEFSDRWCRQLSECVYDTGEFAEIVLDWLTFGKNVASVLSEVIHEAHADVLMIIIGGYNLKDYLQIIFNFFWNSKFIPEEDDLYILRLTAVIGYFYLKNNPTIKNGFIENETDINRFRLWLDKQINECVSSSADFIYTSREHIINQIGFVQCLSRYLFDLNSILKKPIRLFEYTASDLLNMRVSIKTEVQFHVNLWHKYVLSLMNITNERR